MRSRHPRPAAAGVREAVADRGETVIAVGHQPDCGRIAAEFGDSAEVKVPPAGVVELQLRD